MDEYIRRGDAIDWARHAWSKGHVPMSYIEEVPTADVVPIPAGGIGEVSDGYHTFNSLYNQRLHLFAALCNAYPDKAWKSKLHADGEEPFGGGWFIAGIDTPEGSYTYHSELKDWDLFRCRELERGKPWDGHTDKDVARLLSLPADDVRPVVPGEWIDDGDCSICSHCKKAFELTMLGTLYTPPFCPHCGADMRPRNPEKQPKEE